MNKGIAQVERAEQAQRDAVHILADDKQAALWAWAQGEQSTPQPSGTALCGMWSASRSMPGQRWQSVSQHNANRSGAHCATCEAIANAKLIAAAPDMLKALEDLFEHCSMIHTKWGEGCNIKEANAAIEYAKAVIARAKAK